LAETQKEILEVEIERLLPGGVGLAHAEGMTLFVSLAAPGDVLRVAVDRVQGKVGFASIVEILKPSPLRIEPLCPYFGLCGGCDFQQLTYETQLNAKVEIIRDCLHRIAKIEIPADISITPSPNQWHYRARAMWQVDSNEKLLGYFERGSNRICDVDYCAVLVPELQSTLELVRTEIREQGTTERLRDIEVVAGDQGVSMSPPLAGFKPDIISRVIGNETYHFSAEAFFQVNHELLVPLIAASIGDVKGQTAIDLYSGVGLFTLPLARRFERVYAVEGSVRATQFARRNLEFAKLNNVEVVKSRVGDWLKQHAGSLGRVDFLLLDPPRTGCENRDIAGILKLRPTRITYVSCDPATLARDIKKLIAGGYAIDSIAAFDMFPQTHHVETIVHLTASSHPAAKP
jgi:23S rRNA (uracil1939-C5)-methyltransferase